MFENDGFPACCCKRMRLAPNRARRCCSIFDVGGSSVVSYGLFELENGNDIGKDHRHPLETLSNPRKSGSSADDWKQLAADRNESLSGHTAEPATKSITQLSGHTAESADKRLTANIWCPILRISINVKAYLSSGHPASAPKCMTNFNAEHLTWSYL